MQIHEITQLTESQVFEAGFLDTIKTAAMAVFTPGKSGLAGLPLDQRIQALNQGGAIKNLANATLKQWYNSVVNLNQQAGGQPIDDKTYHDALVQFVDRTMFRGQMANIPDQNQKAVLDGAVDTVVKNRNNIKTLANAFQQLVGVASGIKTDPRVALQNWQGKTLTVNLTGAGGGLQRQAAKFKWTGQYWQDEDTGQAVSKQFGDKLTNMAIGSL
jgi:hypothetical protein